MLFSNIQTQIKNSDAKKIIKQMGYNNQTRGLQSLDKFMNCSNLAQWLRNSNYDFTFSSEQFFIHLSQILAIKEDEWQEELKIAKEYNGEFSKMRGTYIFIDTHFKRASQPIFVLAFLESKRRIYIAQELLVYKTTQEILDFVGIIVKNHYKSTNGNIQVWGTIYNYALHLLGETYVFDTEGNLTEEPVVVIENLATLSL